MKIKFRNGLNERIALAYSFLPKYSRKVLDIGCSTGHFTKHLLKKSKVVYGVDINEESIMKAKKFYPKINFSVGDAGSLPFKDNFFDAVCLLDVLEHTDNERKIISEICRILKSNGILILSVPHKGLFALLDAENIVSLLVRILPRRLIKEIVWLRKRKKCFPHRKHHKHYSLNELQKLLSKFDILNIHQGGFLFYPLVHLILTFSGKNSVFLQRLKHFDYSIDFGGWSYNTMLVLKINKK